MKKYKISYVLFQNYAYINIEGLFKITINEDSAQKIVYEIEQHQEHDRKLELSDIEICTIIDRSALKGYHDVDKYYFDEETPADRIKEWIKNQRNVPSEIIKLVDKKFWELI